MDAGGTTLVGTSPLSEGRMTISIVIPTRNPDHCTQLIAQCRAYGYRDIVVVHSDGTPAPRDAHSITTTGGRQRVLVSIFFLWMMMCAC